VFTIISSVAEKTGVIELIHLPEVQHFVELKVAGKPEYHAGSRTFRVGSDTCTIQASARAPETDRK